MKELKKLELENTGASDGSLTFSHLSDIRKCHVMTSSYGEVTSTSINKTEAKRVINWLNKWIEYMNKLQEASE